MRLDYAIGGGSLTLAPTGPGRWGGSVPAAQLLAGYDAGDVNHNFVGFVRLLSGTTTLSSYNSFINVVDSHVPAPAIRQIDNAARATPRILNLYRSNLTINDVQSAVQQFYAYYHDDFDFVQVVFALPSWPSNRYHFMVRNAVSGIGATPTNNGAAYGSAAKLKGVTVFPIDTLFDATHPRYIETLAVNGQGMETTARTDHNGRPAGAGWIRRKDGEGGVGHVKDDLGLPALAIIFSLALMPLLRTWSRSFDSWCAPTR